MKISIGLLLSVCTFLANANCPDGFYYDETKELCINQHDPSVTAERAKICKVEGKYRFCNDIN